MKHLRRALAVWMLLSWLLGACAPPIPTPTPQPTSTPRPTQTAVPIPSPSATALPLPAPRLLEHRPTRGAPQPPNAPIELLFDQPMDTTSVAQAFVITPTVTGRLLWEDDRRLRFVPAEPLARATRYRVSVGKTARSAAGRALEAPIAFDFETAGYLAVGEVQPAPGAQEILPNTSIVVVFNRPVVPMMALEQQGTLPHPLTFTPPVAGTGEWINTSVYRFRPDEGLLPATRYTVTVTADLTDTAGTPMAEPFTWSFTTWRPKVVSWQPYRDARHVGPRQAITITFNQPMDHASVEAAFTFTVNGEPVGGRFRWQGGDSPSAYESVTFVPEAPLPRDATCRVQLAASAHAPRDGLTLKEPLEWVFFTVRTPGILSVSPADGAEDVPPDQDVQITFASPMDRRRFAAHLTILPRPTYVYTYWRESDTKLRIRFPKEPRQSYTILLDAEAPDRYGAPLGQSLNLRFTTGDLPPYVYFNAPRQIGFFNAYTNTVIYATYRNVEHLQLSLYSVTPRMFVRMFSGRDRERVRPTQDMLVRAWEITVNPPPNVERTIAIPLTDAQGEELPPGLYQVVLTSPEMQAYNPRFKPRRFTFARSYIHLLLKYSRTEALVWATDLATGEPVADLPIRLSDPETWRGEATTDADGLARMDDLRQADMWRARFAFAGQPGDPTFAVAYSDWDYNIRPWDFHVNADFSSRPYAAYLYTDRPIYRPGQTVYFKGIVRDDDDAHYTLPTLEALIVTVEDPRGRQIYRHRLTLSDMGTLSDALTLDAEAPLGTYYIAALYNKRTLASTTFRVAEYRKPDYRLEVTTDRPAYMDGDEIAATVEATYYFGGAVSDAPVEWSLLSGAYTFHYRCPEGERCPRYSWREYEWTRRWWGEGEYGHLIAQGRGTTDAQGRARFTTTADLSTESGSRRLTIEATVTDVGGRPVSRRTTVIVHKGAFYVGVAPRRRVAQAGQEQKVDLLVADWESRPVADIPLTVVLLRRRWYNVRRQAEDGRFYWDWTLEETPVFTTTATTDGAGKAVVTVAPPEAGSYKIRAIAHDAYGHEIRSAAYLWVWGSGEAYWRRTDTPRIELIADKSEYQVGDVAQILIPSPYATPVRALVTIERGHIVKAEVIRIQGNGSIITIPIEEAYVPDIFISVVLMQGATQAADGLPSFKIGMLQLPVSTETKALHITLEPDRPIGGPAPDGRDYYHPRETATYDIYVTDHAGRPVEAELSLRLADLAVLALADERGPTLMARFWSERGLSVRTAAPLLIAMEAYNRELAPKAKGGGGGGGGESGFIRTNFADTAFWAAAVRTDAGGHARVEVPLPDNLTTWRMQARGITADTLVGRAEVDIRSTLDVLVRPVIPRFLVVGDELELATVVHNNTDATLPADVTLTVDGLSPLGPTRQTVTLPPHDRVKVTWPVRVVGEKQEASPHLQARVRMEVSAGAYYDGREDTLPVYRYTVPEVIATAGQLSTAEVRQEVIWPPAELDPTRGELTVRVDGSLTAATADSLRYLTHYPYECVEQTVSRFLPNVLTYQVLDEMGLARPQLRQTLEEQVSVALQRLYGQQHYDGGWGWWAGDASHTYLTAYVLHGLLEAREAGFTVDEEVIQKAADYLREHLPTVGANTPTYKANRAAYQLYVLGEYLRLTQSEPHGELGRAVALFDHRERLSTYGKAILAVALGLLEPEESARVDTLVADLLGQAIYSATGTHWEEAFPDYWNMGTDIRTTATVLWALSRHQPDSVLLPQIVRWLMSVRRGDGFTRYWESTHTTAWVLMSLVAYMRASGELRGSFDYAVTLNGQPILQGEVSRDTLREGAEVQIAVAQLLAGEANRLLIERKPPREGQSGEGQLYYTLHLRYFLPGERVEPLERGIIVARRYEPWDGEADGPLTSARVGDLIRVKLTIIAPNDLYYVVVEDPLPAGCEAVDTTLKTESTIGRRPTLRNLTPEEEDLWYRRHGWGWWWFSHAELRDEKAVLFATYLPRGTYEYTYVIRANVPGNYRVIPTTAY